MVLKKRLTTLGGLIKRPTNQDDNLDSTADTPEANAARGVRSFCECGGTNSGEEVLYLPTIVEAAVASPGAAAAAASQIRKFLSKENYSHPQYQYNAVMLIRILADNPGPSFTKCMDKQFADTCKHLLRNGQDPSVAQILRESLDALEREKAYDTNLAALNAMWKKEKTLMANAAKNFGPRTLNAPAWTGQQPGGNPNAESRRSSSRTLPPPAELVGRIEEARTSAKLLLQLVQSTPPNELLGNDLVKEFSERCMSAQRSIQGYINCDNPPPDDDTMLTLIETNEQLSLAASKHQRAVLQARRLQGASPSPPVSQVNSNTMSPPLMSTNSYTPPVLPARNEAPVLPPLNVGSGDQHQLHQYDPIPPPKPNVASYKNDELPLPPTLQAGQGRSQASAGPQPEDDPFADHHSPGYAVPAGAPSHPSARVVDVDDIPSNGYGRSADSPTSHNPGYQPTPSYPVRQESSANGPTMHGMQRQLSEEEEYAREYPVSGRPPTSEETRGQRRESDVSPIAERGAVTYRY
ncbi:hypothetical protein BDV95DRAFT_319240 [Massariosphaeria phaeospora]|uniref:GAT domain-containing protein n=1 Tax=Massariosphaeria phaeospora TaxID=100035 RepID=A0A7C8IE37_9PLEO|nr:hypothetical protein BDV95DRAFT_319240 [Massariosphaeria phaeospora]